jgi:predicted  nucleic acid-binding Zn-ribbon protein
MDANQSIKSSLIHNGLSAEKEEAVRKFYQNFLRIMGSASEYGLDFQFVFQVKVTPSPEEMPSAILDASASAAGERAEDMEARHKHEMEVLRDTMRAECDKKCGEHDRRAYALGYAYADQKWNPVYKAVCEELELVRKEGANHQDAYIRVCKERDNAILAQVDLRQELDEMVEDSEKLEAHIEELRMELASAKGNLEGTEVAARAVTTSATQVVEGLRKELTTTKADLIRAQNAAKNLQTEVDSATVLFQAMRSDLERLNAENKDLQKKNEALLELVGPTQRLMTSNPEFFGGEAKGTSSPRPSVIATQWRPVSEEETERAEKFLKGLEAKGTSSPRPPAIVRLQPVKEEDEERVEKFLKGLVRPVFRDGAVVESASSPLPGLVEAEPSTEGLCCAWPIEEDQPTVCGAAGCIDCPAVEVKPKPNYNHPNWPSPITKRFAKHIAKHSGGHDPKTIKTHQDALEFIAKRANVRVETLLNYPIKHYQTQFEPWTLEKGPSKFYMGTAPTTWWC